MNNVVNCDVDSFATKDKCDDALSANMHWAQLSMDKLAIGNLRDSLRLSIQQQTAVTTSPSLSNAINHAISRMLEINKADKAEINTLCYGLFEQFKSVYERIQIPRSLRTRRYICSSGLVISPDHCLTTIRDGLRVHAFVRGIDKALKQLHENIDGRLHIVYPACGPLAPLLLPLLHYYKVNAIYGPQDIRVTLIDIQEGAVLSLQAMVRELGLSDYVTDIQCIDALKYQPKHAVHMVVLEAMQHGFSREGHFQFAQYYERMLSKDGLFIPSEISISAALNIAQREFVDQWASKKTHIDEENTALTIQQERTNLGEILNINRHTLCVLNARVIDESNQLVECGTVAIPKLNANHDKQTLIICSRVRVFENEVIDEYESGITHALPDLQVCVNFTPQDLKPGDLLVKSGDSIKFYYCLNGLPGFLPTRIEGQPNSSIDKYLDIANKEFTGE